MSDRIEHRNLDFVGAKLEIGRNDKLWDCRLQGCQVTIAKPNGQWVSDNVFTDCDIHVEGRYTKVWPACQFIRCRFTGTYYNTDIGVMKDGQCDLTDRLVDCDFSKAKMHFVRMFNCDVLTIKFPSWPHVSVFDQDAACDYLSQIEESYAQHLALYWRSPTTGMRAKIWNLKMYLPTAQRDINTMISIKHTSDQLPPDYPILNLDRTRAVFENCPGVII